MLFLKTIYSTTGAAEGVTTTGAATTTAAATTIGAATTTTVDLFYGPNLLENF